MAIAAGASTLERDRCWHTPAGGARCNDAAWGGTVVCREHFAGGMRRFLADRGFKGRDLEARLEKAMEAVTRGTQVRAAEVRQPGRLLVGGTASWAGSGL